MIATLLVFGFVLASAITDLLRHKIYNAVTYPGILIALGWNLIGSAVEGGWFAKLEASQLERWQSMAGWIGIGESLLGFVVCGLILVVCFVFFEVGGGDVKLLAMVGAFLGVYQGIEVLLWSFILGGAFALIALIWRYGAWSLLKGLFQRVRLALRSGSVKVLAESKPDDEESNKTALYLAPSTLVALVIVKVIHLQVI